MDCGESVSNGLEWLPKADADWDSRLGAAKGLAWAEAKPLFMQLANHDLDLVRTIKLDRAMQKALADAGDAEVLRLALLGSSTVAQLLPGIRVGALRRGIAVRCHEADYGLYLQELADPGSALHAFSPQVVLLAIDARRMVEVGHGGADAAIAHLRQCWSLAKAAFNCAVLQQTVLPVFLPTLGNNEHRLAESPAAIVDDINTRLRPAADQDGVHLLALDAFVRSNGGIDHWYEPGLWNRAKQEVSPRAAPLYGEQVGRLLGALRGLTAKCLVLDLDNTLWGGVIGDDGLEGIVLGQGDATGEAFVEMQKFAKSLLGRGIILAVCSKNDDANARLPFEQHPDMVLKLGDIACFVANWSDKAHNIRSIAGALNIGLDSLVFADDNPVERGLIRRELPMVAVPELPEDPAEYVRCLARAGYFETLSVTSEDRERGALYTANAQRDKLRETVTDMASYLAALNMELIWRPFDRVGLPRIVQLANKTNQFNLTTIRYLESDLEQAMADPDALTLQLRLKDAYGDNGIISLILARKAGDDMVIETWLMSCRVLGRQVEEATLGLIAERARQHGVRRLIGEYRPTAKNGMVRDHYAKLGFSPEPFEGGPGDGDPGITRWALDLDQHQPVKTTISIVEGPDANVRDLQRA